MSSEYFKNFTEHLRLREGYREEVYLDTLGKVTCGTGHLLSPEENAQYAVGDTIDTAVLDRWLEEDSEKAWNAVHDANMVKSPGVKAERPNPFGLPDLIKPEGWVGPSHEDNHGDIPNII